MFEAIKNFFITALNTILFLLPNDPLMSYLDVVEDIKFLKYLNWFIPINDFIAIGEAWLAAIVIFYCYSAILRFVNAID